MPDASSPNKGALPRYTLVSKKSVFRYCESLLFLGDLSQFSLINLKRESFWFPTFISLKLLYLLIRASA